MLKKIGRPHYKKTFCWIRHKADISRRTRVNGANGPVVLFRGRLSDARWAREHWPLMRGKERLSFGILETNISHTIMACVTIFKAVNHMKYRFCVTILSMIWLNFVPFALRGFSNVRYDTLKWSTQGNVERTRPSKQCKFCIYLHDKSFHHSGLPDWFSWSRWSVVQVGQVV